MPEIIDLSGKQFGRWTVISLAPRTDKKDIKWVCKCSCGTVREVLSGSLRRGISTSCGCYQKEIRSTKPPRKTPTYNSWDNMIGRCYRPSQPDYKSYGGRGIIVDPRWRSSFDNFFYDMGPRPEGTTLDRIDVDGNYEPSNCRWTSNKEQQNNKRNSIRIPYNGEMLTVEEFSNKTGIPEYIIRNRIFKGVPLESISLIVNETRQKRRQEGSREKDRAIAREKKQSVKASIILAYNSNPGRTLASIAKEFNVSAGTVRNYLQAANA